LTIDCQGTNLPRSIQSSMDISQLEIKEKCLREENANKEVEAEVVIFNLLSYFQLQRYNSLFSLKI
jgi:hypothetical protein